MVTCYRLSTYVDIIVMSMIVDNSVCRRTLTLWYFPIPSLFSDVLSTLTKTSPQQVYIPAAVRKYLRGATIQLSIKAYIRYIYLM